jgi:hypothetical protein
VTDNVTDVVSHAASLRLRGRWVQAVRLLGRHGDEVLPAQVAAHIDLFHWTRAWWSRAADLSIRALTRSSDVRCRARAVSDAAYLTYLQAYQPQDLLKADIGQRLENAVSMLRIEEGTPPVPDPAGEVNDLRPLLLLRVGQYRENVEKDLDGAKDAIQAAHRLATAAGDRYLLSITHRHLATIAMSLGDDHSAVRDLVLSLKHREAVGWLPGQVPALLSLAAIPTVEGNRRRELHQRAHRIATDLRWPPLVRSMVKAAKELPADDFALR